MAVAMYEDADPMHAGLSGTRAAVQAMHALAHLVEQTRRTECRKVR